MAFSIFQNMAKVKAGEGWLPPSNEIIKAGAFGAILGMATSGLGNYGRVKAGEINTEEAVGETLTDGAKTAATMAVASVASHIVRAHPVAGFAALAAVGAGTFLVIKKATQEATMQEAAVQETTEEDVAEGPTIEVAVEEVTVEEPKPKRRRARRGTKTTPKEA